MLDNQFHGQGKLTFAKDDLEGRLEYKGLFENGMIHGDGTLSY